MAIQYDDLDREVRAAMLDELQRDERAHTLYVSSRLTDAGAKDWATLLREAIESHDDSWLETQLRRRGSFRAYEQHRKPKGGFTQKRIPDSAAETLAEGEFNRFYARGLCVVVLAAGGHDVEVYRGKIVAAPRPESEGMIGRRLEAHALLDDLRTHPGVDTALRLPPGPNSGLTVRRPR